MFKSLRLQFLLALSLCALSAGRQALAADLPEYRPALLTHGQHSLVNLIDADSLVKRGQGSATVMFNFVVSSLGFAGGINFYRGTPHSDMLGQEVVRRCNQAQFSPAIFRHQPVDVFVCGTATLIMKDGKPHLRIYLNQEESDLVNGNDFISPQFVITPGFSKFRTFYEPPNSSGHSGIGSAAINVDATGHVTSSKVAYEYPAGMGFGQEVAGRVTEAVFVPGFRNGKLTPGRFTWTLTFDRTGPSMPTG